MRISDWSSDVCSSDLDPKGVMAFILFIELEDYFAVADTVDEVYEQIVDAFEQPALPDYPYDDNDFQTVSAFYQWVDGQLLAHHNKYRLISFGERYTNDFQQNGRESCRERVGREV